MTQEEIKAQIKLIDHLLAALCDCEMCKKGKTFMIKVRDKLKDKLK